MQSSLSTAAPFACNTCNMQHAAVAATAAAAKVARQIFHKHNRAPSILMILMDKSAQNDGRKTCWEQPGQRTEEQTVKREGSGGEGRLGS